MIYLLEQVSPENILLIGALVGIGLSWLVQK